MKPPLTFYTNTWPTQISTSSSGHYPIMTKYTTSSTLPSNWRSNCHPYMDLIDEDIECPDYLEDGPSLVQKISLKDAIVALGHACTIKLPDGAVLHVADDGSYRLEDDQAKLVYKANNFREFNRYINASDLLEEFIAFLGTLGAKQSEVLDVPIEVLINWLILRAAAQDEIEPPANVKVEGHPKLLTDRRHKARCLVCRRFIPKRHVEQQLPFCGEQHMIKHAAVLRQAA